MLKLTKLDLKDLAEICQEPGWPLLFILCFAVSFLVPPDGRQNGTESVFSFILAKLVRLLSNDLNLYQALVF